MASPEGNKKGSSSSGGQQPRRRSHGSSNESSPQNHQLSLRAPVIRHRDPKAPVVISGWLFKQGSDGLMLWKKRWFALSQYCLFYYDGPEEEKLLGSLLLPGYTIRPCLAGDRDRFVYRKYAFKAEHRNTRSFYLAAESRPAMIQWMNALSLAAILQDSNSLLATSTSELNRSHSTLNGSRRSSKAVTDKSGGDASFDSTAPDQPTGQRQPLYANAPPKPRRALNTSRDSHCSSSPDRSPERSLASTPTTTGSSSHRALAPPSEMYGNQQVIIRQMHGAQINGRGWPQQPHGRPVSAEVSTLLLHQQQQTMRHRNSPQQTLPAERRTPDAYGRFKTEYEDVYNNSTASSASPQMVALASTPATVVTHRSEVARRVPPRPHSVDFLQSPSSQPGVHHQPPSDYWSSEQRYAQQVRQSVMRNYTQPTTGAAAATDSVGQLTPKETSEQRRVVRDPAEISRDVKESALWSYVQAGHSVSTRRPAMKTLSSSQENLIDESAHTSSMGGMSQQQSFHRSASARLPRMPKQQPDLLNSSLADHPIELDNKRIEQREESMKRLLEWKQRMLQSPLTRKSGNSVVSGGSGARSSERSTPTLAERDAPSPRVLIESPVQSNPSSTVQLPEYGNGNVAMGNFATMRRTVARAAQDLLHQEHLFQQQQLHQQQQQQQQPVQLIVAFRASLKRPVLSEKMKLQLDEEADVRKEFTYEYVLTDATSHEEVATGQEAGDPVPKVSWPRPSLMREKSSAVADLRARSESPSANRVLVLKDVQLELQQQQQQHLHHHPQQHQQQLQPPIQSVIRARPKPPPKPSLHDLQQAFQLKRNGLSQMMMMEEEDHISMDHHQQHHRLSFAESLPESLAGFAATIVSEDGGTLSPCPFEPTVSPLISECDWPHNTTGAGSSPAPLPDLMSLASVTSGQLRASSLHAASENLYMNAPDDRMMIEVNEAEEEDDDEEGEAAAGTNQSGHDQSLMEDHYLPMTSTKLISARSPPPLPAANYQFEENAYVEMTDNGKIKTSPPGRSSTAHHNSGKPSSVFAGVFDPSYRSPESPRYCEITDHHGPSGGREQHQMRNGQEPEDVDVHQNHQEKNQTGNENRGGGEGDEDQPHYEFIYKASSQIEPVYMEVPQSQASPVSGEERPNSDKTKDHHHHYLHQGSRKTDEAHVSAVNRERRLTETSHNAMMDMSTASSVLEETMDDADRSLELMVAPPRHPRFSISDTFRPASYFLRLETIPSEENGILEEQPGSHSVVSDDQSDTDPALATSPPPIPTSPPPLTDHRSPAGHHQQQQPHQYNHSRSQSLDTSQDYFHHGRTSRNSLSSELSHGHRPPSDLSRRRPLTIVRSLEDLLVDAAANDDHLAALSTPTPTTRMMATSGFQGSTQSLSSSIRGNNAESSHHQQPLYENVTQQSSGHVRQASRISISSNTSRRTSASPAGSIHSEHPPHPRQRLGSAVSLNSNLSASSMSRSEQSSGAPYYYSDLLGKSQQQQATTPDGQPIQQSHQDHDGNGSLRSSSSRSAQAQAAKQAYQHSMDRLRTAQRRSSPPDSLARNQMAGSSHHLDQHQQHLQSSVIQTPTTSGQFRSEPRQLMAEKQKRAQTPDLLANHPEQDSFHYGGATPSSASVRPLVGEVMRRVRSLEGLVDEEPASRGSSIQRIDWAMSTQHVGSSSNGSVHLSEPPRYARDPTRGTQALHHMTMMTPNSGVGGGGGHNPVHNRTLSTASHGAGSSDFVSGEFSPWDEDQLWRDKLRRASIRHTRSMDMLDEIHQDGQTNGHSSSNNVSINNNNNITINNSTTTGRSATGKPVAVANLDAQDKEEEEDCYERLLQYSATLERTKRGQTYLDGYLWDEMEQRFRKPGRTKPVVDSKDAASLVSITSSTPAMSGTTSTIAFSPAQPHPFLEDGLPPPAFEIDREKLRQWDLMSTAPVPASDNRISSKEGGRRPAALHSSTTNTSSTSNSNHNNDNSANDNSNQHHRPSDQANRTKPSSTLVPSSPPPPPPPQPPQTTQGMRPSPNQPVPPDLVRTPGGTSPVQAVAAGLNHATTGAAGKAINGIKVAYQQSGLTGKISSSLVTTQQPTGFYPTTTGEIYHSDTEMPPKKGKLPPMIGHDQPSTHNASTVDNKVQLSAGDLLGRTHEELVLLLIQLRRQSSALVKARDACLLEMESQVKLAALDISHRQECLIKTGELKHHVKELEKQLDKLKPMISLVDNMVKLGSSMSPQRQKRVANKLLPDIKTTPNRNATPHYYNNNNNAQQQLQHQPKHRPTPYESPTYSNLQQQQRNSTMMFHSTPQRSELQASRGADTYGSENHQGWEEAQISQLESKHHQLAQLEKFVREEGAAIQRLTRNQQVLRLAIRGIRQQTNAALMIADYGEVERCRQQQLFLERELSKIHSLLALSSKRLEDAAVEISRIEREISALHQHLHRIGANNRQHQSATTGSHSLNRSGNGREMAWLEAELNRVQQHVSQLQTRRLELSSQVNCLTSADYFLDLDESYASSTNGTAKRRPLSTWCETDLDSLNTVDRLSRMEDPSVVAPYGVASHQQTSVQPQQQQQYYGQQQQQQYQYEDDTTVDINEADERMKRYYGIVPKQSTPSIDKDKAEIRTVRIVKRESEKRQRDKSKSRYDDNSFSMDELAEEDQGHQAASAANGYYPEDPIMDDPVLSQFSHVLTLPRRNSKRDETKDKRASLSQRNSIALNETQGDGRSFGSDQWRGSLRPRRNLSSLSLGDRNSTVSLEMESAESMEDGLGSLDSTQRSPVLTPVYTSDAAREIVEEMRRQDMIMARRAVPRHKRRHITISCSQPLVLEALTSSNTQRATMGRARDDVDLQRALRLHHPFAPDVVRSTITQSIRINEKTIDNLLCAPDKILIPERYVPEQEVEEIGEEEKQKRLKKTESIRRMLTGSAAVDLPRPASIAASSDTVELSEAKQLLAKERQQRDHFINLNQMLVEEIKEKSKMAAVHALANMKSRREHSSEEDDWSPPADPLPIYQQRYNYLT